MSAKNPELTAVLQQEFDLDSSQEISEEELTSLLAEQIAYMLENRLEFLLSLMYRMDVAERKVNEALSPASTVPPHLALAKLVIARQKERLFTKKHYGNKSGRSWEDDL